MMYCIRGYCHLPTHLQIGAHGFAVDLSAEWPDLVRRAGITDEQIQHMLKEKAEHWLDAAGYGGHFTEESGPGSGRKYPARCVRVTWGEWGPEHITVPGNACGLDIEKAASAAYTSGTVRRFSRTTWIRYHRSTCWRSYLPRSRIC